MTTASFPATIRSRDDLDRLLPELLRLDPDLKPVAAQSGELPLKLHDPGFEGLVHIILGQQVSQASAGAVYGRLIQNISPLTPENFLAEGQAAWVNAGLTRPRQRTIVSLCQALENGRIDLLALSGIPADEALSTLTSLKGIGPWTAEVYLMFCEGHRDIFPAGDLALKEAVRIWLDLEVRPSETNMRDIASRWKPFRSVAARLFWAYYKVHKQQT